VAPRGRADRDEDHDALVAHQLLVLRQHADEARFPIRPIAIVPVRETSGIRRRPRGRAVACALRAAAARRSLVLPRGHVAPGGDGGGLWAVSVRWP